MCYSQDCDDSNVILTLQDLNTIDSTFAISMVSDTPISGFEIELTNITITGIEYGDDDETYILIIEENTISFAIVGTGLDSVILEVSYTNLTGDICIINPVFMGQEIGNNLAVCIEDCIQSGCTDSEACNYDPDATADDGSCFENDCAGECGGTGEIDLSGACCTTSEESPCIITGCDLPDSTVYLTETSMAFNSSKAIKQILLTMEGSVIPTTPLSGAAGDAGFVWLGYSNSSNWVLGKNQSAGTSIPANSCGELFNIEYLDTPVSISVDIKDDNDIVIGFSAYFDSGCSDESACNYNPYSVNDVDGACAYIDDCGECGGPGPDEGFDCDGNELAIINPGLIPETYNIHNIYPNPFNPVTNIEFGLPENTFVQIIVYDIKGRQIATLMNSFQFAGYYSLTWDASDSPSGVYFIDMTSDGFKQTRQVVLMK